MIKKHRIYILKIIGLFIFSLTLIFFYSADLSAKATKKTSCTTKSSKSGGTKSSKSQKKSKKHRVRKKRNYNPDKTRSEAEELIRANSAEVSELAGLEPVKHAGIESDETAYSDSPEIIGEMGEDIAELEREDDVRVDIDNMDIFWSLINAYNDDGTSNQFTAGGIEKEDIMSVIMDWLGTPYHFGGDSERGIDCSAFVQTVFSKSAGIVLPRTAREQFQIGVNIKRSELQFGDMVFFHTYSRAYASHVGIFLGDNLFAHASSRYGVTVSSLESTFYNNRFCGSRRLSAGDVVKLGINNINRDNILLKNN